MSSQLLYVLVLALTIAACFTLYRAVWQAGPPVAGRLAGHTDSKSRLAGGLTAAVQQAIERMPVKSAASSSLERNLSSTLTYAGFRSAQSVAVFQLVRGTLMIGLALAGLLLAWSSGRPV